jgi:hypothetical protein
MGDGNRRRQRPRPLPRPLGGSTPGGDDRDVRALRRVATLQAVYYVATGVWPLVSRSTFEAITGPKTDYWLVKTVGVLVAVIGTTLGIAARRSRVPSELAFLGMGSAVGFGAVEALYATPGRISRVYLADVGIECAIAIGWVFALQERPK